MIKLTEKKELLSYYVIFYAQYQRSMSKRQKIRINKKIPATTTIRLDYTIVANQISQLNQKELNA